VRYSVSPANLVAKSQEPTTWLNRSGLEVTRAYSIACARTSESRRHIGLGLRHEFVLHGIRVLVAITEEKRKVGRQLGVHPRHIKNGVDLAHQMTRRDGIAPRPPGRLRCTRRRNAQIRDEI
jgi:hypothetical protein